jgi:hypothetical protein
MFIVKSSVLSLYWLSYPGRSYDAAERWHMRSSQCHSSSRRRSSAEARAQLMGNPSCCKKWHWGRLLGSSFWALLFCHCSTAIRTFHRYSAMGSSFASISAASCSCILFRNALWILARSQLRRANESVVVSCATEHCHVFLRFGVPFVVLMHISYVRGQAVAWWLKNYTTGRKVVGLILDEVNALFKLT